jgi:DNA-binding transcriptional ArsR family regulator
MLKTTVVNASHHLTVLRHASLVRNERRGRYRLYSLAPSVFQPEDGSAKDHINLGCCRIEIPKADS